MAQVIGRSVGERASPAPKTKPKGDVVELESDDGLEDMSEDEGPQTTGASSNTDLQDIIEPGTASLKELAKAFGDEIAKEIGSIYLQHASRNTPPADHLLNKDGVEQPVTGVCSC